MDLNKYEPLPQKSEYPAVWDLIHEYINNKHINSDLTEYFGLFIEDTKKRDREGEKKYGTRLRPYNGRNSLIDAYQELMDAVVYMGQYWYEVEFPNKDTIFLRLIRVIDMACDIRRLIENDSKR